MLKKIYLELVAIRKELQTIRSGLESSGDFVMVREPYSTRYEAVKVGREGFSGRGRGGGETHMSEPYDNPAENHMTWFRFELTTENDAERERLERVLQEHNLSRRDLAIILFGLRVRPGFGKEFFGI